MFVVLVFLSESIANQESCEISAVTQSNFAYDECKLSVLIAFLINPDIEYGAGGSNQQTAYKCNELGGNMARFTQSLIMITRSTIIYEIISPGAAGSSIYV